MNSKKYFVVIVVGVLLIIATLISGPGETGLAFVFWGIIPIGIVILVLFGSWDILRMIANRAKKDRLDRLRMSRTSPNFPRAALNRPTKAKKTKPEKARISRKRR